MGPEFEAVHSVDEYYDGPRTGVADLGGVPHIYRSLYLDSAEWNPGEDRFDLTPLDGGTTIFVRGEFRVRPSATHWPPGVIRPLEVRWSPIE